MKISINLITALVPLIGWMLAYQSFAAGAASQSFEVRFADSMQKVRKESVFASKYEIANEVNIDVAGKESESFQLLIIAKNEALKDVSVSVEPLNTQGGIIDIGWYLVDYVLTGKPEKYEPEYVGLWPDRLLEVESFGVLVDNVQPLWFRIDVPEDATAGLYSTKIKIVYNGHTKDIKLNVKIRNFSLPFPGRFAAPFSLYLPYVSKWLYGDENYLDHISPEQFYEMSEFIASYRLTAKNIGCEYVSRKLGDEVLPQAGENIGRVFVHKDVTLPLEVDMSMLHKTIGKLSGSLPDYSFTIYRMPPFDELLKSKDSDGDRDTSKEDIQKLLVPALEHIREWKRQNLPLKGYIYGVDEPRAFHLNFLKEVYSEIKKEMPDVKILQVISVGDPAILEGVVDIWCPLTAHLKNNYEFYQKRLKAGDRLWTYVCCWPTKPFANFFIDTTGTDHRVLFWQAYKAGATGFLYWSAAMWEGLTRPEDSTEIQIGGIDIRKHISYSKYKTNGDGLLAYPADGLMLRPSIRLEIIRDGIEDYEYLTLLKKLVGEVSLIDNLTDAQKSSLEQAKQLLTVPDDVTVDFTNYTSDSSAILKQRQLIADAIDELITINNEQ